MVRESSARGDGHWTRVKPVWWRGRRPAVVEQEHSRLGYFNGSLREKPDVDHGDSMSERNAAILGLDMARTGEGGGMEAQRPRHQHERRLIGATGRNGRDGV